MASFDSFVNPEFIFDEAPIGFISFEPSGRIVKGNSTFYSWFQKTEAELSTENFFNLLTKGSTLYFQMVINPLLNLRNHSNEINLTLSSNEGNFDALFNAKAYKDDQEKIILINAYLLKIIDRKNTKQSYCLRSEWLKKA